MGNQQRTGGKRPLNALFAGLAHLIHHKVTDPARRRARSRAGERELARLDDRLLRDIGLTRSQVHAAGYGLVGPGEGSSADAMRASRSGPDNVRLKRRAVALSVDGRWPPHSPSTRPEGRRPYAAACIARE
jgi:uncharacterized protein YjiS (DUF1127 family)